MKKCSKCGLSVEEGAVFGKDKNRKDGLSCYCKKCNRNHSNQYRQTENGKAKRKKYTQSENYKEAIRKYQQTENGKEAKKKHLLSEKHRKTRKQYVQSAKCKESRKRYKQSERYKEVREEYKQSGRMAEVNRIHSQTEKCKKRRKKYEQTKARKEMIKGYRQTPRHKETRKRWQQTEKGKALSKRYYAKNKASMLLSGAIRRSLKGNKDGKHWEDVVGWTLQQFKRRFAQLFKAGMTWENHGEIWEIDHIIPLSVHNITSSECADFKRAWALSNLQPLLKEENNFKRGKIEKPFQPTLF